MPLRQSNYVKASKRPPARLSEAKQLRLLLAAIILCIGCGAESSGTSQSRLKPIPKDRPFTFVVMGDNRGDSYGNQFPVFHQILKAVNAASPNLVLNTGDMINGYAGETASLWRRQWKGYREAIARLKAPVFHTPGNHDLFDAESARLWKEIWGATYYSFDYGSARFISLDTETEKNRLGRAQFEWLKKQLAEAKGRHVFLFLHRPLFPVDGHVGNSLDAFPEERDRLHSLLAQYRGAVKGVFQGHEHLYNFEERDGVPYYITGGAGAELYVPRALGGFYHFLLVSVSGDEVSVAIRKVWAAGSEEVGTPAVVTRLAPGAQLESWENPLFWYTWNQSVATYTTAEKFTEGRQGLSVSFDLAQYEWPTLYLPLYPARDFSNVEQLMVDVYVPPGLAGNLLITPTLEAKDSYKSETVRLRPGWNTVTADLRGAWLPVEARRSIRNLQWVFSSDTKRLAGRVIFDNMRLLRTGAGSEKGKEVAGSLSEGWESKLLWGVYNDEVRQEATTEFASEGLRGVKLSFDLAKFDRPLLYTPVYPMWDLEGVAALTVDVYVPKEIAAQLTLNFAAKSAEKKYNAPAVILRSGWNKVAARLDNGWLPRQARKSIEQMEWRISADRKDLKGWVVFDNFRAE